MTTTTGHDTSTITLRCISPNGDDIASPLHINTTSTFAAAALTAVLGDRTSGALPAARFARATFAAMRDYEDQPGLRARVILKHLRALDRLALAAVTRDIPATITWA